MHSTANAWTPPVCINRQFSPVTPVRPNPTDDPLSPKMLRVPTNVDDLGGDVGWTGRDPKFERLNIIHASF